LDAAFSADRIVHFSPAAIATNCSSAAGFSLITAGFATSRLVLETLFSIEFLFTGSKREFGATLFAK
jgi:hypothetical protein